MHTLILSLLLLVADPAPATADLHGKVIGPEKQPIIGATVMVYSAAPRKGEATQNPADYPDCAKSTKTDAAGEFQIAGVDSTLTFRLLILADDCRPLMLSKVDPAKGQINAALKQVPRDLEASQMIKGHVVDDKGNPIVGARIEPYGAQDGTNRWWGSTDQICEKEAYSDAKGQFLLITKKPDLRIDLRTFAPHFSPTNTSLVSTGDADQEITLNAGATVIGRVLSDGKPLSGVHMCLIQKDRGVEHYLTDFNAYTDADGKFTFSNVHAPDDYYLYGTMKSLNTRGVLPIKDCGVGADGSTTDAGDLSVEPGYTVSGSIFCSDEKPVPAGTKVRLDRWNASDSIEALTSADGKFEFKNVPAELVELWSEPKGYHVSDQNVSFEPANARFLLGKVDDNITDLRVQLDPNPAPANNYNANRWQTLESTRLTGIAPQQ